MIFQLLMMRKKQTAGGGGPFSLTSATVSGTSQGTSCGSPATATLNIAYSGDPTGVTLKIEQNHGTVGWFAMAAGVPYYDFPYTDFHDEIMRRGSMPVAFLRLAVSKIPLSRDMVVDWKFYGDLSAR